jgi:hypothetical protein
MLKIRKKSQYQCLILETETNLFLSENEKLLHT